MLGAGAIDGEDEVPRVQCPTPAGMGVRHVPAARPASPLQLAHLSARLAALMCSTATPGLPRLEPGASEMPSAEPGGLGSSTNRGPGAPATTSEGEPQLPACTATPPPTRGRWRLVPGSQLSELNTNLHTQGGLQGVGSAAESRPCSPAALRALPAQPPTHDSK